MRTIKYLFILIGLSLGLDAQTIRRVNGTPGVSGVNVYATPQEAHDASVDGDIIYIEPNLSANTNYGNLTINRRVTVIGKGYDLDRVTGSSFDKRTVSLAQVMLDPGSAGSRLTGLIFDIIFVRSANCIIERSFIDGVYVQEYNYKDEDNRDRISYGDNLILRNNIVYSSIVIRNFAYGLETNFFVRRPQGLLITNNIFSSSYSRLERLTFATISNNIFRCANTGPFADLLSSTIVSNIFDSRESNSFYVTSGDSFGNTISNNLCTVNAGLPAGNGNVNSVSSSTVFKVANPWTVSPFLESNLELAANSPARTVGPGGTPIGAFSGTNPFIPSGLTNVPIITDFTLNGIGNTNSPLQVTIKARSNN